MTIYFCPAQQKVMGAGGAGGGICYCCFSGGAGVLTSSGEPKGMLLLFFRWGGCTSPGKPKGVALFGRSSLL